MQPPLLAASLKADELDNHLISSNPFNAMVTTLTTTARLISRSIGRLDFDLTLLDQTAQWRTGSTAFRNARILRMRLQSDRGLRWITIKVFKNGSLHITGTYATDVTCFVLQKLCESLNELYLDKTVYAYAYLMGDILLANYRLTLGKRVLLRDVASIALDQGYRAHLDPREVSLVIKILVDNGSWASLRMFATGSLVLSLPRLDSRARQAAFESVLCFLQLL